MIAPIPHYDDAMPYDDAKQSRAAFLRKLTYYLCGIAIGFMVLGVLHNAKKQRMLRLKQEETARQMAPKETSPAFPPPPAETAAPVAPVNAPPTNP